MLIIQYEVFVRPKLDKNEQDIVTMHQCNEKTAIDSSYYDNCSATICLYKESRISDKQ